jgi:hypothetical protein
MTGEIGCAHNEGMDMGWNKKTLSPDGASGRSSRPIVSEPKCWYLLLESVSCV